MLIESSKIILQEVSANWPILAEIGKIVPTIPLLETVIAHIKRGISATINPHNSNRITDTKSGTDFTVEPGENISVTWHCPAHQSSHTIFIDHKSSNIAEVAAAGSSMGNLSPDSESLAMSPDVTLEWVE